jgi:hypothetical protein
MVSSIKKRSSPIRFEQAEVDELAKSVDVPHPDPLQPRRAAGRPPAVRRRRRHPPLGHRSRPLYALPAPLFYGELPAASDVLYLIGAAVASLAVGPAVFRRVDDRIAVEL